MNKENLPLISIILPVYNGEKYMRKSIESCLAQTWKNWELLIVDDGSTDQSAEIAKFYVQQDSRIRYYKNRKNMKLPRTLNHGFYHAKGEYLTWTSDDNYYDPEALERMANALMQEHCDFVFAGCRIIDDEERQLSTIVAPEDYKNAIWDYDFVGACFLYTRKVYETIGGYDPNLFLGEDYDYWMRIFASFEVTCIRDLLYSYRRHGRSLSATHLEGQYEAKEKALIKNFAQKKNPTMLDRFYYYRGLHGSRNLRKNLWEKYRYFPKLFCYKIWHQIYIRL